MYRRLCICWVQFVVWERCRQTRPSPFLLLVFGSCSDWFAWWLSFFCSNHYFFTFGLGGIFCSYLLFRFFFFPLVIIFAYYSPFSFAHFASSFSFLFFRRYAIVYQLKVGENSSFQRWSVVGSIRCGSFLSSISILSKLRFFSSALLVFFFCLFRLLIRLDEAEFSFIYACISHSRRFFSFLSS